MISTNNQTGSILDGLVKYFELQVCALKKQGGYGDLPESLIMDGTGLPKYS